MRKSHAVVGSSVLAVFLACGGDDGGGSSKVDLATTCARICVRLKAPACAGDNPNTCMDTCTTEANSFPSGCSAQSEAYLECASGASYVCDADHQGQPSGCDSQTSALASCVAAMALDGGAAQRDAAAPVADAATADGGTSHDAGLRERDGGGSIDPLGGDGGDISVTDDAGLDECVTSPNADACQVCSAGSCCAEVTACGSDCNDVIDCTSACDDGPAADSDACYQACADANSQAGIDQFNAIADCLKDNCDDECF